MDIKVFQGPYSERRKKLLNNFRYSYCNSTNVRRRELWDLLLWRKRKDCQLSSELHYTLQRILQTHGSMVLASCFSAIGFISFKGIAFFSYLQLNCYCTCDRPSFINTLVTKRKFSFSFYKVLQLLFCNLW